MSFFQPSHSNTSVANPKSASYFEFKGRWAGVNFIPAITGVVLALGISRIGGDAIVQDLHGGATGVFMLLSSLAIYFVLSSFLKRTDGASFSTVGIYRLSRNPAYLAFFLPLASLGYFDWQTAAASMVIYVLAMNLLVIHHEEDELQSKLGEDYSAYRAATPRWFA